MTGARVAEQAGSPLVRALLLRVGMDRGTGGALGPIFPDGTFEYMPIPESNPARCAVTYAGMPGRHVATLSQVLPPRLAASRVHVDPDFGAAIYGDAAPRKRRQLAHLAPGDRIVFYAGLVPRPRDDQPRLFAIGFLSVRQVHSLRARDIADSGLRNRFGHTAHFLRDPPDEELVLVEGDPAKSRLFSRARPLGDAGDCLLRDLAPLGYSGSLRRAVGHWLAGSGSLQFLDAWLEGGPSALVEQHTRLVQVATSALQGAGKDGALVIADEKVRDGDWVVSLTTRRPAAVKVLARVNQVVPGKDGPLAHSSLYWSFSPGREVIIGGALRSAVAERTVRDIAAIRALISWFDAHYRIGFHGRSDAPPGRSTVSSVRRRMACAMT